MVDITRCEVCGKVIPALDTGCAWCDAAERDQPGFHRDNSLALPIRMLLWLFVVNLLVTALLAVFTLVLNIAPGPGQTMVGIFALLRLLLSVVTVLAFHFRAASARWLPLCFLSFEALGFVALQAGLLPADRWIGSWLAPLWNLLFVFLFFREDVRAWLDPGNADRREVGALIDAVQRVRPGDRPD